MLTEEQNRTLRRSDPGRGWAICLRRYWMPIAAVSEFESNSVKAVRLMGRGSGPV